MYNAILPEAEKVHGINESTLNPSKMELQETGTQYHFRQVFTLSACPLYNKTC